MAPEFKKIGHNIDLIGLVIHQIDKKQGIRLANVKAAEKLIQLTEKEKAFIGRINKAYYQKSNPVYGIFGIEDNSFKNMLAQYIKDKDFLEFSIKASKHYKKVIESSAPATGGFMIFAHYNNTEKDHSYLMLLTINNNDGYVVSEKDLTIESIKNLDLSKVDLACIINLTKWINIEDGTDTESKTYLSFIKGNKDISYYFMTFIDLDNKTTSTESTLRLMKALDAFQEAKGLVREERIRQRNDVYQYCNQCIDSKKEILLTSISTLIDIENPNDFMEFAAEEKYSVSSIISGDKAKLKTMKYVIYKDKKLSIEFDSSLLGRDIIYDEKKKQMTIKNLPAGLIAQISK